MNGALRAFKNIGLSSLTRRVTFIVLSLPSPVVDVLNSSGNFSMIFSRNLAVLRASSISALIANISCRRQNFSSMSVPNKDGPALTQVTYSLCLYVRTGSKRRL